MSEENHNTELKNIKDHHRINRILLGGLERPAIAWMVRHTPAWVTPDHLTFLGFLAAVLIGVSYWLTNRNPAFLWLANLGFILNWYGDSMDGNLARYRKIERPQYGFFIDHTVDTISETCVFLGIGLSPYVDFPLAALALIGYLSMANLVYITTSVEGEFKISYGSLGPTEARVIAVLANIVVFFIGNPEIKLPIFGHIYFYNLVVIFVILLLFTFFFYTTITQAIKFEKIDRQKLLAKQKKDSKNK